MSKRKMVTVRGIAPDDPTLLEPWVQVRIMSCLREAQGLEPFTAYEGREMEENIKKQDMEEDRREQRGLPDE